MTSQENTVALPLRAHTILGVCEAIGEDFGFNPVLLRIPFAASVLISPMWAIIAYFALGAVVLVSRFFFPKARNTDAVAEESSRAAEAEIADAELPLAA